MREYNAAHGLKSSNLSVIMKKNGNPQKEAAV